MERQSNMELLRIVSMMMVLAVHADGASLGLPELHGHWNASALDFWRLAVESLAIAGVNCFTMISGYFGIRLRVRSVAAFLFECVFYSVGIYTCVALAFPDFFSWRGWLESWLVLTHTDLWYVPAYFMLMLLSPLLNAGAGTLGRRRLGMVVAALLVANIWCGWWWGASFNPTGYTVMQLVMVYLCGRYAGLHLSREWLRSHRPAMACLAAGAAAAVFVSSVYLPTLKAFAYNSPAVMALTIGLVLFFAAMDFRSAAVNYAARSAFAVYLIHKAPLVWGNVMRPGMAQLWAQTDSLWLFTAYMLAVIAGIYLVCMAADAVRRLVWQQFLLLFTRTRP